MLLPFRRASLPFGRQQQNAFSSSSSALSRAKERPGHKGRGGNSATRSAQLKALLQEEKDQAPSRSGPRDGGGRELAAEVQADTNKFFDILMLPTQSPMVSKKEELKQAEVDEDRVFRQRVRTAKRYNLLIRAQAERTLPLAHIQRTFENMLRHGIGANVEIYTSMLVACAKNNNPPAAEEYLARMISEGLEPNIWTYTALAQAYTRAGQLESAFQVLERLKQASIHPNVVIYTSLIHGCLVAGNVERAWDTFDHMRQREAIEPDQVTFTLMITACAQKGQVERARNLMEEMQLLQLNPTEVTFNAQIDACAQRRDYYAEAFLNLERMKAAGFRPDEVTYSTLLHASAKNGDIKMAEVVFKNMADNGMLAARPEATCLWNSLLSAYAAVQPHADSLTRSTTIATASRIQRTMKQIGQQPDRYTANTLLSLYTHAHHIRAAETLFDAAFLSPRPLGATASAGDETNSSDVTRRASASPSPSGGAEHDSDDALWAFGERFSPDVVTFTCLIQLYADTLRPEKALRVWQLMSDSVCAGVQPNMRTYEYMVRCLARAGYLNSAMKTLREMRGKGFVPNHQVATLLMQRTLAYPELRDEVRRLTNLPLPPKVDEKSVLALRLRRAGRSDRDPFTARGVSSSAPLHRPV